MLRLFFVHRYSKSVCFLMRDRMRVDPDESGNGEELGEMEGELQLGYSL